MKKINLLYWRPYKDKYLNYGDELSPFIISKLTGLKVQKKDIYIKSPQRRLLHYASLLMHLDLTYLSRVLWPYQENLMAIGSILKFGNKKSKVWGSGFMSISERYSGGKVFAVRGKYTLDALRNQNADIDNNVVLGDPALLLPLVLPLKEKKKYKIGIIPHYSEYDSINKTYSDKYKVIALRDVDLEKTTREINQCEYILSSSLHGIIVAHAYGIPAIWIELSGLEKGTDGFKFKDYFSSVDIPFYESEKSIDNVLCNINAYYAERFHISLPQKDLRLIQKSLLETFPYKNIIDNKKWFQ